MLQALLGKLWQMDRRLETKAMLCKKLDIPQPANLKSTRVITSKVIYEGDIAPRVEITFYRGFDPSGITAPLTRLAFWGNIKNTNSYHKGSQIHLYKATYNHPIPISLILTSPQ